MGQEARNGINVMGIAVADVTEVTSRVWEAVLANLSAMVTTGVLLVAGYFVLKTVVQWLLGRYVGFVLNKWYYRIVPEDTNRWRWYHTVFDAIVPASLPKTIGKIEAAGFIEMDRSLLTEESDTPSWVLGTSFADIDAGRAVERHYSDSAGESVVEDLLEKLTDGDDQLVVGKPGIGKSTLCKMVGYRWWKRDIGPVFYRLSDKDLDIHLSEVTEAIDQLATYSQPLFIVENTVNPENQTIFYAVRRYADDPRVSILLETRDTDYTKFVEQFTDSELASGAQTVTRFEVPEIEEDECKRFKTHVEKNRNWTVPHTPAELHEEISSQGELGGMILLMHLMAPNSSSGFIQDVQLKFDATARDRPIPEEYLRHESVDVDRLRDCDSKTLQVVSTYIMLLNAADIELHPDLVMACGYRLGYSEVRQVVNILTGWLLFEERDGSYRTYHEQWSIEYIRHLAKTMNANSAQQLFETCLDVIARYLDDSAVRNSIREEVDANSPPFLSNSSSERSKRVIESLFMLGVSHPSLAVLYGPLESYPGRMSDLLPTQMSSTYLPIQCTIWRAMMCSYDESEPATSALQRARAAVQESDELSDEARAKLLEQTYRQEGNFEYHSGDLNEATTAYKESYQLAVQTGNGWAKALNLHNLGLVARGQGRTDDAEEYLERGRSLSREQNFKRVESLVTHNLAELDRHLGRFTEAIDGFEICRRLASETGYEKTRLWSLESLGDLHTERGNFKTANEYLHRCLEKARSEGFVELEAWAANDLSRVNRFLGAYDEARTHADRCAELNRELENLEMEAWNLWEHAEINIADGYLERAEDRLKKSGQIARKKTYQKIEIGVPVSKGKIHRERGEFAAALELQFEALEKARSTDDHWHKATCSLEIGETLRLSGADGSIVRNYYATAFERYMAVDADWWAVRSVRKLLQTFPTHSNPEYAKWRKRALQLVDEHDNDRVASMRSTFD